MEFDSNIKYKKLYYILRSLILSGILQKGDQVPSENRLKKKYACSRETIRKSLTLLKEEGLIESARGSGTYVAYDLSKINEGKRHVGLILSYLSDYLFPSLFSGIKEVLDEADYKIDVGVTKNDLNVEHFYLNRFLHSGVSGLIVEGSMSAFPNPNINFYHELEARGIPILFIHNHYCNLKFSSIEMADAGAAYQLTETLIKNGHKKIAGIFKSDDLQGIERYRGFIECMADYHIPVQNDLIQWYTTEGKNDLLTPRYASHFRKKMGDTSGFFFYNDEIAYPFLKHLGSAGADLKKLSTVSFDDLKMIMNFPEKLLSAVHPKEQLGEKAAHTILAMMADAHWADSDYSYHYPVLINDGSSVHNYYLEGR